MTRWLLAVALLIPTATAVVHPSAASAQDTMSLAGRWALNKELSQFPREVGFNADWMANSASAGDPAPGGGGQAGGGSSRNSFPVSRVSREESMLNRLLTGEVRVPPVSLAVTENAAEVTITADKGAARSFHPTGQPEILQLDGVSVTTTAAREDGRLIVRYRVNRDHEVRYAYSRTASPPQLVVEVQFLDRGKGETIRRVYDASPQAADAPAATAPAPRPAGAPAIGGAAQEFDRQPDAQFKGLNELGVVVEGVGTQATTCGLSQDAIHSAVVKQLSGAGLKVTLNSDEDTYVYVNVQTATLANGLCISRYDAFLYTHATAGLEYHPTPVLVDVSLMHKGSLAAGAAAAHAESVMRGLQDYVGQITTRITNANR